MSTNRSFTAPARSRTWARSATTVVIAALLAAPQWLAPESADAQRRGARPVQTREGTQEGPTQPAPTMEDLPRIVARLHSTNADEVREAIDLLSVIDRPEVIPPLAELLRGGASDAITDRALEALRGLAAPTSLDVLSEFARHRRPTVRRKAYQAIAAVQDRRVPALLEQGLRDSDRSVRSACADALGAINSRSSVDVLFLAFDRGVIEAAAAIGKLGNDRSVERFTEHLGRQQISVMLSGYHEFVRRNDISDATKTAIVRRLAEVSGGAVREFMAEYLSTFGERDRGPLRTLVEGTYRRIPVEGDTRRTTTAGQPAAAGGSQ